MTTEREAPLPAAGDRAACDLLISGALILDLDSPEGVIDGAAVAVRGEAIVDVGPRGSILARWRASRTLDGSGQVLAPGFVDHHVHLGAYLGAGRPYRRQSGPGLFAGAGDVRRVLPAIVELCAAPVADEIVAEAVRPALQAMLRAGFTGVVDAGGPGVGGVIAAAAEVGIRAAVGPSLADTWHDSDGRLVRQRATDEVLAEARDLLGGLPASETVRPLVSAIEPTACSDELLAGIARLASEHGIVTHAHSHVSAGSVAAHDQAFGRTATERLRDAGLLGPRCTLMHAGWLSDEDVAAFAQAGLSVNYNPTGNAMLGFGVTGGRAVPRLLDAGVRVVLGSDYAPSTVSTPFEAMRAALLLQRDAAASDDAMTLEQVLEMASGDGAALGRPGRLGRIAPGRLADLVLVDIRGPHHLGTGHPVPALALHARAADVSTVIVGGRVVFEGRA